MDWGLLHLWKSSLTQSSSIDWLEGWGWSWVKIFCSIMVFVMDVLCKPGEIFYCKILVQNYLKSLLYRYWLYTVPLQCRKKVIKLGLSCAKLSRSWGQSLDFHLVINWIRFLFTKNFYFLEIEVIFHLPKSWGRLPFTWKLRLSSKLVKKLRSSSELL